MNCDEAFDRMTSPKADADAALESHLRRCPRCRDMQETLAPAMEWLAAEGPEFPAADSAAGQPFLTDETLQVAERAAHRLRQSRIPSSASRPGTAKRRGSWLAVAGLAALCLFAVVLPLSNDEAGRKRSVIGPSPVATKCLWQLHGDRQLLPNGNSRQVVATCIACHMPVP